MSLIPSGRFSGDNRLIWKAVQVEMTPIVATGAAVESTMKASFSRLTRTLSVKGRMVLPMISELA